MHLNHRHWQAECQRRQLESKPEGGEGSACYGCFGVQIVPRKRGNCQFAGRVLWLCNEIDPEHRKGMLFFLFGGPFNQPQKGFSLQRHAPVLFCEFRAGPIPEN